MGGKNEQIEQLDLEYIRLFGKNAHGVPIVLIDGSIRTPYAVEPEAVLPEKVTFDTVVPIELGLALMRIAEAVFLMILFVNWTLLTTMFELCTTRNNKQSQVSESRRCLG